VRTAAHGLRLRFSRAEMACGGAALPVWSLHRGRAGGAR
jgi:hypothetical protein